MSHRQNRKVVRPFTMPKNPQLMKKINDACIQIKLHHTIIDDTNPIPTTQDYEQRLEQARQTYPAPTWLGMVELLNEVYQHLNDDTYQPVKY